MSPSRLLALLALLFALPASAQYVATTTDGVPYPALTSATPINLVAAAGTPNDRGRATIPIGFTFPYYDRTYTQITVTANGIAFLEPSSSANATADFPSNNILPNVSEPNGLLAPFWDDLNGRNPGSLIQSQALTGPNGAGLAIEWYDWNQFATSSYSLTFQVRIWENGLIEYHYGDLIGSGLAITATVGLESPQGSVGTYGKSGCTTACNLAIKADGGVDFQSNQLIAFGPAAGADLSIKSLKINSITTIATDLQVSTTLSLRNFGTLAANAFTYRLFLSTDTQYNAGVDVELAPGPQGPLSIPALGATTDTVTTTVPKPASGSFYILAVVDDANVVSESNENNNLGATTVPLSAGVDLVAQGISGPPLAGPGEVISTNVTFSNQGIDAAGNVPVKIWLSIDNLLSTNDLTVHSTTVPVSGGENVVTDLTFPLPNNVPAGDYYFILQLDSGPAAGTIIESSDANNVKVSAVKFTARQADLIVDFVRVLEPLPPYGPARYAFFAEPIRVEAVVRNQGGATAPNVSILFYLSDNDTLNGISDPFIGEVTGLTIAPNETKVVTFTGPLPATAVGGQPLIAGTYFFFAAAVAQGLVETSNQNNFLKSDPQAVRNPAPDLISVTLRGPLTAGAGEALLLTRTLANIGNRPAGAASYRYYLSANTIITESDVLLPMLNANGTTSNERSVTLGVGVHSPGLDTVIVPPGTAAASWYVGLLIDPPGATGVGAVIEIDEENNGLAGQSIGVVALALGLATPALPAAVVGLGYQYQLSGQGGDGTYSYALATGDDLPDGLSLSMDGKITGVPTTIGATGFSIVVTSSGRTAIARRALQVAPFSSILSITSSQLPPIARLVPYELTLGVQGGRAPYGWRVIAGALPQGVLLSAEGRLSGTTSAALGAKATFTLQAFDSVGNHDEREFSITVVDGSALLIASAELPDGKVGSDYFVDVVARNASGAPVLKPLKWSVVGGALPEGVALEPTVDEKLLITGNPKVPGVFSFTLQVEDARFRSDTADFVMRVVPPPVTIVANLPAQVLRGDTVSAQFVLQPTLPDSVWSVRDGQLPRGLTFDPAGKLDGVVADDAAFGAYNFTVAVGGHDRATALRSFSVEVASVLTPLDKGCGCGGAPGAAWALIALVVAGRRARRNCRNS